MANTKKNRILDLDPEHFREVDGVVFDLDSFARHCAPHPAPKPEPVDMPETPAEMPDGSIPAPVFVCDPVHTGWYPVRIEGPSYPIMAGAVQPTGGPTTVQTYTAPGSGSFTTSFLSSYMTSFSTLFTTSWATSWYWGSGSYWYTSSGSQVSSGSGPLAGGYGLELI